MQERLLRYSIEHQRPIRMIWQQDGKLFQSTVQIECVNDGVVQGMASRPKRPISVSITDILATDFRKSDVDLV